MSRSELDKARKKMCRALKHRQDTKCLASDADLLSGATTVILAQEHLIKANVDLLNAVTDQLSESRLTEAIAEEANAGYKEDKRALLADLRSKDARIASLLNTLSQQDDRIRWLRDTLKLRDAPAAIPSDFMGLWTPR